MKYKNFIVFLTVIVSLLCLYYLSFTWVSANVQQKAIAYATDEAGNINFSKKQVYLDSVWRMPVYHLLGAQYTYEEVKENELGLGLDLQGGMHVTLEISPIEIIKGLAGHSQDKAFLTALTAAQKMQQVHVQTPFTELFYQAYKNNNPSSRLRDIFATAANRSRVRYEASDQGILNVIHKEVNYALDRSFNILRTRLDRFGTSQPNIQQLPGSGRIQIELPGVNNPERVRKLLQGVAQLTFWEVYDMQDIGDALTAINTLLVQEQKAKEKASLKKGVKNLPASKSGKAGDNTLAEQLMQGDSTDALSPKEVSPLFSLLKSSYGLAYDLVDTATINQIFQRNDVKALLPNYIQFVWEVKPHQLKNGAKALALYPIKTNREQKALLEGDVITEARQSFDDRGRFAVSVQMNSNGARNWKKVTANNIGKQIAIVLDNYVYSAPVVNTEIPNGSSQISGNFTIDEAKDLANILKAGSLPAPVKIVEEAIIGPTLSKASQTQGIRSMLIGLGVVVLFMLLYYAKGGAIANVALMFNLLFILGILAQLNASLTLPGIAGIVLTMGMAIDANVLIFERIREELKNNLSMKMAINHGYTKAYSSIIDSNVTTFLTGVILYVLGQGPVRGFATTLMIGIASSFFAAVFITRVTIAWLAKKGTIENLTFSFSYTKNLLNNLNIDFLTKRRIPYIASSVFITIGFLLMIAQGGLNLGVDFTGGRAYVVAFDRPMEAAVLKTQLAESFNEQGTEVKTYGSNHVMKITTGYLIKDESTAADQQVQAALVKGIESFTGLSYVDNAATLSPGVFTIASAAKVGAIIAGDIKTSAQKSIILSLVMIFLYILVRFHKWQFGVAAVLALLHDSLVVFAAFAIARAFGFAYEVDQVFIAAILTIIGYSINDTVVVFDRIRETMRLQPNNTFLQVANLSINETMSRTVITSLTTFLVVLILFIFGGEVLRGFSFALLIGIVFGTYSSIFIASPLVMDLSKK